MGIADLKKYFSLRKIKQTWNSRLTYLSVVLLILFVQLFTGFFQHLRGLVDFVNAFLPWMKTGVQGKGHEKVFTYWLQVLWQAEPVVLLGLALSISGMFSRYKPLRVMSVFSLSQLLIYSWIPYKTVWCILTLIWGFYFVIALTASQLQSQKTKAALCVLTVVLLGFNIKSTYDSVYRHPLDMTHPYVYVNSTDDLKTLQEYILLQARRNPELLEQLVQVGMAEQWPWPWVLHSFKNLSYHQCGKYINENALIYFCDLKDHLTVDLALHGPYWKIKKSLRQTREPSVIYLKKSAFPEVPFTDAELIEN